MFVVAVVIGSAAAWYYARGGLTLSHYDARAHLVVARRIIDSLTPGWRQIGAVWLPLPHLLNLIPVQWDWSFRTGFSGVAFSILTFAAGLAALCRYLFRHVDSWGVALGAPLAVLANPAALYLQSTPMTEPLLFGLSFMALLGVDTWVARGLRKDAHVAGALLAAVVLTRYEGWLIAPCLIGLAWIARGRPRHGWIWLGLWPAAAIIAFLVLSYFSSGVLLATDGFYVPNNPARGALLLALAQVVAATYLHGGEAIMLLAIAGGVLMIARAWRSHGRSLLPLSLFASAVLPLGAFYSGHPLRVRYMVATMVAAGACAGLAFAWIPRRARTALAAAYVVISLLLRPPFSSASPMLAEAQWEVPFSQGRRAVTAYLEEHYDGTPILANMGSLAHYMQETSSIGLSLRNFLHEGNGDLWTDALEAPRLYVRWILIEEQARGGGPLALRAREDPAFLAGFVRVCEGGGLALYQRTP
jgi:hypothetical protein